MKLLGSFQEASENVCCFLVLDSVTSALQRIRQPKPRDGVHDVCVFVCKCILGSPRASQPLNIEISGYAFSSTSTFPLGLMPFRLAVGTYCEVPTVG